MNSTFFIGRWYKFNRVRWGDVVGLLVCWDRGLMGCGTRLLKNSPMTRDAAAENTPTRDASPPLVLAFLQTPNAITKRYHPTLALMGATRLEAADKIAVYRVKSSFSSLF